MKQQEALELLKSKGRVEWFGYDAYAARNLAGELRGYYLTSPARFPYITYKHETAEEAIEWIANRPKVKAEVAK